MKIKISPSVLNNFNRFLDESIEYFDYEKFMDTLTKPIEVSDKMRFGSACHKVLELGNDAFNPGYDNCVMIDNLPIYIAQDKVDVLIKFRNDYGEGIYEQRHRKVYQVGKYEVVMSMIIDMITSSGSIFDFKFVQSQIKSEQYLNSMQWKCYVDAMDLDHFIYWIWTNRKNDLVQFPPIVCFRTKKTHLEIVMMIERFIEFLENEDLIHLFLFNE